MIFADATCRKSRTLIVEKKTTTTGLLEVQLGKIWITLRFGNFKHCATDTSCWFATFPLFLDKNLITVIIPSRLVTLHFSSSSWWGYINSVSPISTQSGSRFVQNLLVAYPGYQRFFLACDGSFVSSAAGRHVFDRRPKTDHNRKPRMKSLWHPGYLLFCLIVLL